MVSNIKIYEKESQKFNPYNHLISRIKEIEESLPYGAEVASKWKDIFVKSLTNKTYPVMHPIGKETFSLYIKFRTGVFEFNLDIDGATSLIKKDGFLPETISPANIIEAVDQGNINNDPNLIKPNHKNPVMILQSKYLTANKMYCINGNHRIFEAYRNNDNQIDVFLFKDFEFAPFIYDDLSKAIYLIEIDYMNIVKR
ncbi:hypothetical protein OBCHQ24_05690 [Oceanobacillus iheyensis]|nr:hypothetical protein OBCHQ24_05690 [Oceanobacillus iheyensis]